MVCIDELTEERLQECIDKHEFVIYLQPQYSVSENTIVGAEALARWFHEGAFISPGEFIPVLEQKGMVTQLDRYLWECVFALQAQRQQAGHTLVPISLNVSREDFNRIDVYQTMIDLSRQYDIDPENIHIEITESAFVDDNTSIYNSISSLRAAGFMILIDDFGSGYSALNILKDIEADVIKLDMKFFDLTEKNTARGRSIIVSVITMAQLLDLGLIAEGVENTEQLDILQEAGCDIIQGYFFYRPMSTEDFNTLLDEIHAVPEKTPDLSTFGRECYEESLKLMLSGKYNDALTLAKRASTQISAETDARLYCDLENLTGIIYGGLGNELMALEHYLCGLSVASKNDISIVSAKIYNNIGSEYQRLNNYKNSIRYFELSLNEQMKNTESTGFELLAFKTNLNLCMGYTSLGEYDKAEEYLDRAYAYMDNPEVSAIQFHYLTIQSELYMKTNRQEEVRKSFPKLMEMLLNTEDSYNFWDNFERLGHLALELEDYAALKQVIDRMEWEFDQLPEEIVELDMKVAVRELRLAYYEAIGDKEALSREEHEYIGLCRMLCLQTKADRATTIDYKIQLKEEYEENADQRRQLDTDQLTGAGNRYKLEKDYKLLQKNSDGSNSEIAIGIIDLDHFKDVNETYGHLQGDHYLKAVSKIIRRIEAGCGGVYRYNGDAFAVLLVDVDLPTVEQNARQISCDIQSRQLRNPASDTALQTVSQSYIVTDQFRRTDIWQLLSYATRQLYSVKNNGRNAYRISTQK